jgi:pimeloyl-ACP methyl ester carboxylesterase
MMPAQLNFMRPFYMRLPPTSQGALPGSWALLIEHDGDQGGQILWTDDALPRRRTPMPKACGLRWAQDLHNGIAGAELLILDNSGHLGHLEEPDTFLNAVVAFTRSTQRN